MTTVADVMNAAAVSRRTQTTSVADLREEHEYGFLNITTLGGPTKVVVYEGESSVMIWRPTRDERAEHLQAAATDQHLQRVFGHSQDGELRGCKGSPVAYVGGWASGIETDREGRTEMSGFGSELGTEARLNPLRNDRILATVVPEQVATWHDLRREEGNPGGLLSKIRSAVILKSTATDSEGVTESAFHYWERKNHSKQYQRTKFEGISDIPSYFCLSPRGVSDTHSSGRAIVTKWLYFEVRDAKELARRGFVKRQTESFTYSAGSQEAVRFYRWVVPGSDLFEAAREKSRRIKNEIKGVSAETPAHRGAAAALVTAKEAEESQDIPIENRALIARQRRREEDMRNLQAMQRIEQELARHKSDMHSRALAMKSAPALRGTLCACPGTPCLRHNCSKLTRFERGIVLRKANAKITQLKRERDEARARWKRIEMEPYSAELRNAEVQRAEEEEEEEEAKRKRAEADEQEWKQVCDASRKAEEAEKKRMDQKMRTQATIEKWNRSLTPADIDRWDRVQGRIQAFQKGAAAEGHG